MKTTTKAWLNAFFLAITLVINAMGVAGTINGVSQVEISNMYLTLITPSPFAFSIWSLIYLSLISSVIFMIVKVTKKDAYFLKVVDEISVLFWISCVFNIGWMVLFSFVLIELSVLPIVGLVITLALILMKLLKVQEEKRWLLPFSFGIYTGWLFIATAVNIAAALVKMNWNGFGIGEPVWAAILIGIATVLVIFVLSKNRNVIFPLPVAWAFFGIHQFLRAPDGFNGQYSLVEGAALIGMIVLIGAAVFQLYRNKFKLLPVLAD